MTLPSDLPVSKRPPRPFRPVRQPPKLLALMALALAGGLGLAGCTQAPAGPTEPTITITITASGGPAAEACRQIDKADVGDLPLMRSIGLIANATRDNDSMRIAGGILQQAADAAIHGTANRDPDADRELADVGGDARYLRRTCVEFHFLPS